MTDEACNGTQVAVRLEVTIVRSAAPMIFYICNHLRSCNGKENSIMFEDMAMLTIYGSLNAVIILLVIVTWYMFRIESQ